MTRNSDDLEGFRDQRDLGAYDLSEEEQLAQQFKEAVGGDEIDAGLIRVLRLGQHTEDFCSGKADPKTCGAVARLIVRSAYDEIEKAQEAWVESAEPWSDELKALHYRAQGLRHMLRWLDEIIEYGREAERILVERDEGTGHG